MSTATGGRFGSRLFAVFLLSYPVSFRERYGEEMLGTFGGAYGDRCVGRPAWSQLTFWLREVAGVLSGAVRERWTAISQSLALPWRRPSLPSGAGETGPAPLVGAAVVFALCLAGYVATVSPTVTFWDAGEFLTASKVLGIPHPPGTPLFVFLSNTWARLFPFGEYAFRVSVMVAVCGALSVALIYLVVFEAVRDSSSGPMGGTGWFAAAAALAAALVSGFSFTVWQNANEAEVYTVSSLIVAATVWLALR